MKLFKYISSVLLAAIIFAGSVGMYIIKDTCPPCGESETVAQMVVVEYESHCNTGASDLCCTDDSDMCCSSQSDDSHDHEQDKYFFQYIPDYTQSVHNTELKPVALIIMIVLNKSDFTSSVLYSSYKIFTQVNLRGGVSETLSLLCTYLI